MEGLPETDLLAGFNLRTIQPCICMASMGIAISFLFKKLDNIIYTFALAISMFTTALFSALFLSFTVQLTFICGLFTVSIALYLYKRDEIFNYFVREMKFDAVS